MRLEEGAEIISFARVDKAEEIEKSLAAEEQTIATLPTPDADEEKADAERAAADEDAEMEKEDTHLTVVEE